MARKRDRNTGDGGAKGSSSGKAKGSRPPAKSPRVRPTPGGKSQKTGSYTKDVQQGRSRRFVTEVISEMKKVSWPNRVELLQATLVVIVAVAIMAVFLGGADVVSEFFTDRIFPN